MDNVGSIYGTTSSTRFDVALADAGVHRLDYLAVEHEGHRVLCQVDDVVRKGGLSYEQALNAEEAGDDQLSAAVQVIGFKDQHGRVQIPRTPFAAGQPVALADTLLVTQVLGLEPDSDGAYMGRVANGDIPVRLSMNMLAQKHVSVLAKTGAGKSYTVGVLLEEFLAAGVPLVILDPHGEYGSLRHANIDDKEIERMLPHGIKPRSFDKQVHEWALDTELNPDAERLRLEGINLEGREIVDLLGGKLSGGQVGLLYQAVKEVKEHLPGYTLQDIMDVVQLNKSAAKWNVINALEALEGTGVFHIHGTEIRELVQPKQATIINLKGVAPDIQEVAVTRLTGLLWEARKRNEVPPFILVCEEAHNFCPERGVGNAISGAVIRTVASEGRKFGMGLVIVSQRPAKIDKNVLSQCNTQFVLKVTNPNDLKAIISSVEGITSKAGDEVQRLPIGTALIAGGGLTQPVFVDIRPRVTAHGGRSIDVVGKNKPAAPKRAPKRKKAPIRAPTKERKPVVEAENTVRGAPKTPIDEVEAPLPPHHDPVKAASPMPTRKAAEAAAATAPKSTAPADPTFDTPRRRTAPAPPSPAQAPEPAQPAPAHLRGQDTPRGARASRPPQPAPRSAPDLDNTGAFGDVARRAEASQPPAAPTWTLDDAPDIHRVAHRVGIVMETRDPLSTVAFIEQLARQNGRDPRMRVGLYAEIARTTCSVATPMCIRCPLKDSCQYHQNERTQRVKARSPLRRLWGR